MNTTKNKTSITIYTTDQGAEVAVGLDEKGEVWLSVKEIAKLYGRDMRTIQEHIVLTKEEVEVVARNFRAQYSQSPLRTINGKKSKTTKTVEVEHYNLDTILRIGYRVKSKEASIFRDWATKHLINVAKHGYSISNLASEEQLDEASDKCYREVPLPDGHQLLVHVIAEIKASRLHISTQIAIALNLLIGAVTGKSAKETVDSRCNRNSPNCGLRDEIIPSPATAQSAINYLTYNEFNEYVNLSQKVAEAVMFNADKHNIASVTPTVKEAIVKAGHKVIVEKKLYRRASYNKQLKMKVTSIVNSYLRGEGCDENTTK